MLMCTLKFQEKYSLTQSTLWSNAGFSFFILHCSRAGKLLLYYSVHTSLQLEHAHFPCHRAFSTLSPVIKNGHIFRTGIWTFPLYKNQHANRTCTRVSILFPCNGLEHAQFSCTTACTLLMYWNRKCKCSEGGKSAHSG